MRAGALINWQTLLPLLFVPGLSASTDADRYPPATVLLFVASWCAPCHAELARLPAISQGARPFRVVVVPFDDSRTTLAMMDAVPAAQRWQPSREMRQQLMRIAGTSGLPFSVAVNDEGKICGSVRQGLDGSTAGALVAGCVRRLTP